MTDNITWTKGKHSLKFGFDGWKRISPQFFTQRSRGDMNRAYLRTTCSTTTPITSRSSLGNSEYYGDRIFSGVYSDDSWKATPHLTVNVGLRYEYQTVSF